jgi:hypothetical protein
VPACPYQYVDQELWTAAECVGFAEKGHLPVTGGTLDQAQWFLDAYAFLSAEHSRLKAEKINNGNNK